ncbi:hypothetical protein V5O48_010889 [Marasmius crinis-equi]|uniref:Pectate lyase n=1 Tax=Marasmius crinis-equi TaxID=585013 RepID=A0ABR3F753_9AGAR
MLKLLASVITLVSTASLFVSATALEARTATNDWPNPPRTVQLDRPIVVRAGETFYPQEEYTRFDRGRRSCNDKREGGDQDAVFVLEDGATLARVVIGKVQLEGVHCLGSCTLDHVYFEDVCEDAITIKQPYGTSRINYGGAKHARGNIVQHNGGGTVIINSFYAEDFGKLYRSCGNCREQTDRHVEINDVWAVHGSELAGINENYRDTATIRNVRASDVTTICQRYKGNDDGKETRKTGSGPDREHCLYSSRDIWN